MEKKLPDLRRKSATRSVWTQLNAMTLAATDRNYGFSFMRVIELYRKAFDELDGESRSWRRFSSVRSSAWRFIKEYCKTSKHGWRLRPESVLEKDGNTYAQNMLLEQADLLAELVEPPTLADPIASCPPLPPLTPENSDDVCVIVGEIIRRRVASMLTEVPRKYREEAWARAMKGFVVPT